MSFKSIIGQPLAVKLCQRWLEQDTTQPLLFIGPEGIGKKTTAIELAKALNCAHRKPSPLEGEGGDGGSTKKSPPPKSSPAGGEGKLIDSCDVCASCRKIASGQHADVQITNLSMQAVERGEPVEKQQNIRIETVMSQRRRLLQSSVEGRWKVWILDDAHRMTADAANVLLKILEEPPERTAIFLITPSRDRLFPTIVSRCQPLRFRPLTHAEMDRCLTGCDVPSETRARLIELALGSPGRALHLNREEQIESVSEAERAWEQLGRMRPSEITRLETRARPSRTEAEEKIQHLLIPALRELRAGAAQGPAAINVLQRALRQLRANVSPRLVLDHMLLELSRQRQRQLPI